MSIATLPAPARPTGATAAPTVETPTARPAEPTAPHDAFTHAPQPLRFPWLSRLARELAPAAPQRPAFPAAPVLGDWVDRSA